MRGRQSYGEPTDRWERHDWWGVVLEASDSRRLARFYSDLLGWPIYSQSDEGAALDSGEGVAYLSFQDADPYVRPVWPPVEGQPQMTSHLDFEVTDLEASVAHALEVGAQLAEHQPQENVRVMLDPDGHPFCLYT
jgi:catechol 2,3-dioxygenase-like lactoylglutathione lyase family enzyme